MRHFRPTRCLTVVAMVASCLAVTGGAAVLTAGPASAATVSNPGKVTVAFGGSLTFTFAGTQVLIGGISATATGTVDSAGNISLPMGSISFAPLTPTLPIVGPVPLTILPTANWTGTINPASGALMLAAPQTAHLDLSSAITGNSDCPLGPLMLNLTTGTSDGAMGKPYNSATGTAEIVDGTFAIPAIPDTPLPPNCPAGDTINGAVPLPLSSGNIADLTATFTPVLVPPEGIALAKSASVTSFSRAGTIITYLYKVTNSGTVPLTGLKVTDPMKGLSAIKCPPIASPWPPKASVTCIAIYTTTPADLTRGSITNTATATAMDPAGAPVTSNASSVTVRAASTPPTTPAPTPGSPGPAPVAPITPTKVSVTG
jgi:uncharacterized repeat protein (TIGR01451 family)